MSFELEKKVHHGEILPSDVRKAADAVLVYLQEIKLYEGDYAIDGDIAVFASQHLYNDPVEFVRLVEALELLPFVDKNAVEITHSLDKNALTVAPKGTHIKLEEVI
jgi:hypothetical protein